MRGVGDDRNTPFWGSCLPTGSAARERRSLTPRRVGRVRLTSSSSANHLLRIRASRRRPARAASVGVLLVLSSPAAALWFAARPACSCTPWARCSAWRFSCPQTAPWRRRSATRLVRALQGGWRPGWICSTATWRSVCEVHASVTSARATPLTRSWAGARASSALGAGERAPAFTCTPLSNAARVGPPGSCCGNHVDRQGLASVSGALRRGGAARRCRSIREVLADQVVLSNFALRSDVDSR